MNGNVWEWCEDDWHKNYDQAPYDGSVWKDSPRAPARVLRGGGWLYSSFLCRPSYRGNASPDYRAHNFGFRLCLCVQSVGD